jgi:threonine synthase
VNSLEESNESLIFFASCGETGKATEYLEAGAF